MKYLFFLLIVFSLSSCVYHAGTMSSNASLGQNNFEVIDLITSQVATKKYFGFGGLGKEALVLKTK